MVLREEELRIQHYEKARELSTVSECSTTTGHSAGSAGDYQQGQQAYVDLYWCCYLWWSI